jgi:hypothetical protein
VARVRLRNGDAAGKSEAAEVEVLCRLIVQEAQAARLRIIDNRSRR